MEIIRNHQKRSGICKLFRVPQLSRHKLINRVKDSLLYSGSQVQLFFRDYPCYFLIHALCSVISVGNAVAKLLIIFIKKHIVNSPGINSHSLRNLAQFFALFHTFKYFGKKSVSIPNLVLTLIVHSVVKTIYFFKNYFALFQMSQNMSSGRSTDINCQIVIHCIPHFYLIDESPWLCNIPRTFITYFNTRL